QRAQYCDPLSEVERQWAGRALACAVFGLARGTIVELGPGWWVEFVNADTVRVEFGGKDVERSLAGGGFLCPTSHVVLFRHATIDSSGNAGPTRHFLEVATWRPGCCEAVGTRVLTWRLYELSGTDLRGVAQQEMVEAGSIWPLPSTTSGGAHFRMLDSGEIEYQVTLDVRRRGRIGAVAR